MDNNQNYRFVCTLTFGDIYGQIIVWLIITLSLASAMAMMGARPYYALATVGLILLSLPFLLFAFVTTLLNHIELAAVDAQTKMETMPGNVSQQQPVQATS